jgi:hypothetical protein
VNHMENPHQWNLMLKILYHFILKQKQSHWPNYTPHGQCDKQ